MSVPVGSIIRAAVRQTGAYGNDIVNVFHFIHDGIMAVQEEDVLSNLATLIDTNYATLNAVISNLQDPNDLKVDVVDWIGGALKVIANIGTTSWGDTYNPANGGESLPTAIAALILRRTSLGKSFGRTFLGGLVESDTAGNDLSGAGVIEDFADFAATCLDSFSVSGQDFVPGIPSAINFGFRLLTEAALGTELAVQRRRFRRYGS